MKSKIFLAFALLLFKTSGASQNDKKDNNLSNDIRHLFKPPEQICKPRWKKGVEESYKGVKDVFDHLPYGKVRDHGEIEVESYKNYTNKLGLVASWDSTFFSLKATAILSTISLSEKLGGTARNILSEFYKVVPKTMSEFRDTVSGLSEGVGIKLTLEINEVIKCIESSIKEVLEVVRNSGQKKDYLLKKINFKPTIKHQLEFLNTVASKAKDLLKDHKLSNTDVYGGLTVLIFILNQFVVMVNGVYICIAAILQESSTKVLPSELNTFLSAFRTFLTGMTDVIYSIPDSSIKNLSVLLTCFVNLVKPLNAALNHVFNN